MKLFRRVLVSMRFAIAAALAVSGSGCAVIYDAETNPSKPIVGLPISELAQVGQIEFHGGRLLAAINVEDNGWRGIAVIDTSADTVIALLRPFEDETPWSIASFHDSLLYAAKPFGSTRISGVRVEGPSGGWSNVQVTPSAVLRHLMPTPNGVLLFDRGGLEIRSLEGGNSAVRLRMNAADYITSVVISGSRIFVARYNRRDLLVADAANGNILDSIPLDSLPGGAGLQHNPEALVAYGGRLFVATSATDTLRHPDTALVAVFDSATLALDTILKLRFAYRPVDTEYPFVPRVADGKWYLPGYDLYPSTEGGAVEVVDLEGLKIAAMIAPRQADSLENLPRSMTCDFLPAGAGKAYAITGCNGYRELVRLSY